ncbi:MAG: cyclodeaminase/cyclohydrolase family protein [Thermoanaerobaculia bacterium]
MSFESQSVAEFCAALASADPTPGGGTASAAAGAIGASLVSMVIALTLSREKYRDAEPDLAPIAAEAGHASSRLLELMQEDAEAYDGMVAARRLPKETEGEQEARTRAMAAAARRATEVPMETALVAAGILSRIALVVEKGNPNASSDAGVAALLLAAAAEGALLNVGINLTSISDAAFAGEMEKETAHIQSEVERSSAQVIALVRKSFKK